MPDMLVRLYRLPPLQEAMERMEREGIVLRRAQPYEKRVVTGFIERHFSAAWADETSVAFARQPVTAFIALAENRIVGFGAYECTRRGYFGPTGVAEDFRGRGIGYALLLACLYGMWEMGYAYAIIGGAGPVDFYRRAVNAEVIEDSVPGIYTRIPEG
ncbi:MAG: GNAT family N-acetyltransferase [Armatimonadota bacterium]|jgi:GNAT superfamily N-acetyltransferase|nr:MAG: N-acetyltransferase [Armatimonadota bacterium]